LRTKRSRRFADAAKEACERPRCVYIPLSLRNRFKHRLCDQTRCVTNTYLPSAQA